MPIQYVTRRATALPATAKATAAVIYVDSDDNTLKIIAAPGATEQLVTVAAALNLLAASGAIPVVAGTNVITLGSAAALTLAAPTAAQNGMVITVTSSTAFAHVITATGLINSGGAANLNTATLAAFPGASVTFMAYNLKWNVIASAGTVTYA